jgi:hypothetical protein
LEIRYLLNIKGSLKFIDKFQSAVGDMRMRNWFVKPQAILLQPMIFSVNENPSSQATVSKFASRTWPLLRPQGWRATGI